jgi:hypothetical protein
VCCEGYDYFLRTGSDKMKFALKNQSWVHISDFGSVDQWWVWFSLMLVGFDPGAQLLINDCFLKSS